MTDKKAKTYRDYTKIDRTKLRPQEQPKWERNLRIANLRAQGLSYTEIAKTIFLEFGELVSTQRIAAIIKTWSTMAKKEGDK